MIEEARDLSTLQAAPHALIFPGVAIALTVLAFNFIGDGLREYLDPDNDSLKKERRMNARYTGFRRYTARDSGLATRS